MSASIAYERLMIIVALDREAQDGRCRLATIGMHGRFSNVLSCGVDENLTVVCTDEAIYAVIGRAP